MREERKGGPTVGREAAADANSESVESTVNLVSQLEKSTPWRAIWPELFIAHLRSIGWLVGPIAANGVRVGCRIPGQVHHDPDGWVCLEPNGPGTYGRKGDSREVHHWQAPEMLSAALHYARLGFAVLPVHGVSAGRCTCGEPDCPSPGKHPCTKHGFKDALKDAAVICAWWQQWPNANIGIATGAVSNLVVIDLDSEAAHAAFQLPHTATVRTGRPGGAHRWFRPPADGGPVPCSSKRLGPDIDVRGERGYVIAPPSAHVSGRRYEFEPDAGLVTITVMPDRLARAARRPNGEEAPGVMDEVSRAGAAARSVAGAEARKIPAMEELGSLLDRTLEGPFETAWTSIPPELGLPADLARLIKEGAPYGQRSEALWAAYMGLLGLDHDNATIEALLLDPANRLSEKPREKGKGRAWLQGEIRRAREKLLLRNGNTASGAGAESRTGDENRTL
jgi:hypothetical protein